MLLAIGDCSPYSRSQLVRWLSGRKQRFAKAPYPKRVPRVRIPPSPFRAALAKERITGTDQEAAYSLLPVPALRLVPVQVSALRLPSSSISFSLPARGERTCDDARHSQFGAASALPGIFFWISWWSCSTRIRSLPYRKRDRRRLKAQTNDDAWPEFSFAGEGIRNPRLGQEEPRARL